MTEALPIRYGDESLTTGPADNVTTGPLGRVSPESAVLVNPAANGSHAVDRAASDLVGANGFDLAAEALRLLTADTRSEETKRAYEGDLRDFFRYRGHPQPTPCAVSELAALESGGLALALNGYKAHLIGRGLRESTVNRRLAAVRSLLRMMRRLGAPIPDPAGLVSSEKTTPYRDTRGPALADLRRLLSHPDRSTLKGRRDYALLRIFTENALRRGELVRCDVRDFEPEERRLFIRGKGRGTEKEPITLTAAAISALSEYLDARGTPDPEAPLFINAARFSKTETRLSGDGLHDLIRDLGRRVLGKPGLHPHSLRHAAITAALEAGADVRKAQRLSRHKDIRTLTIYDDSRHDYQGELSEMLSELLGPLPEKTG